MSGCDYCDEGLPKDADGWHLRVDPEGVEGTQRIPCQARDEQEAWTMVNKIAGLIEERDSLKERVAFLVAEAHGWQPRLEAAEAERDEANVQWHKIRDLHADAVSEVHRLREALLAWWEPESLGQRHVGDCICRACALTRAALATPTKDEGT